MAVGEQRGSLNVARLVKHHQALVAVAVDLQHLDTDLAPALLPLLVAQHHGLGGREIAKAVIVGAGVSGDLEPDFLGGGRVRGGRRGEINQNWDTAREKQEC